WHPEQLYQSNRRRPSCNATASPWYGFSRYFVGCIPPGTGPTGMNVLSTLVARELPDATDVVLGDRSQPSCSVRSSVTKIALCRCMINSPPSRVQVAVRDRVAECHRSAKAS